MPISVSTSPLSSSSMSRFLWPSPTGRRPKCRSRNRRAAGTLSTVRWTWLSFIAARRAARQRPRCTDASSVARSADDAGEVEQHEDGDDDNNDDGHHQAAIAALGRQVVVVFGGGWHLNSSWR